MYKVTDYKDQFYYACYCTEHETFGKKHMMGRAIEVLGITDADLEPQCNAYLREDIMYKLTSPQRAKSTHVVDCALLIDNVFALVTAGCVVFPAF